MSINQGLQDITKRTEPDKQSGLKPSNLGKFLKSGGPGRPVGSKNKVPANLRDDLITVYEHLGGIQGMVEWAKAKDGNRALFYRILASTLPRQVAACHLINNDVPIVVIQEFLGHADIKSTLVYARLKGETLQDAVRALDTTLTQIGGH
jgi:integrase